MQNKFGEAQKWQNCKPLNLSSSHDFFLVAINRKSWKGNPSKTPELLVWEGNQIWKGESSRGVQPRMHGRDWRRPVTGKGAKWRWQSANHPQLGLCWVFNWSSRPASPLTAADSRCRAAAQIYRLQSCCLQGLAAVVQTLSALTLSYRWDTIYFSIKKKKCLPRHI